jgi:hypothetical protein
MTTVAFVLFLWALGHCLAPGMAQQDEPTISDGCLALGNALVDCQATSKTTTRSLSAECIACQAKTFTFSPVDEPCDALHDLYLDAYQKCMTECFPSDYECSQVEMEAFVCTITEIQCLTNTENSGNGHGSNASAGDSNNFANVGNINWNNMAGTSSALETRFATAFPIVATFFVFLYGLN